MPIKITSKDIKIGEKYPKVSRRDWAQVLRLHFLAIVEDSFVIYCNSEKMTPEIDKQWKKFKRVLEDRL